MVIISENYKKAFVEVEAVINCLNDNDYNKIPQNLKNEIILNKDKKYNYEYDENLEYYKWNFMPETKAILYNIFKNYLATEKQIEFLRKKERYEINKIEEEKKKKYDYEILFENSHSEGEHKEIMNDECNKIIEYKETIIKKVIRYIKAIFRM